MNGIIFRMLKRENRKEQIQFYMTMSYRVAYMEVTQEHLQNKQTTYKNVGNDNLFVTVAG